MRTKPVVTQTIYILPDLLQEFNPIWTEGVRPRDLTNSISLLSVQSRETPAG